MQNARGKDVGRMLVIAATGDRRGSSEVAGPIKGVRIPLRGPSRSLKSASVTELIIYEFVLHGCTHLAGSVTIEVPPN